MTPPLEIFALSSQNSPVCKYLLSKDNPSKQKIIICLISYAYHYRTVYKSLCLDHFY